MALDHLLPGQTQALIPEGPLPTEFESRALFKGEDLEVMLLLMPEGRRMLDLAGCLGGHCRRIEHHQRHAEHRDQAVNCTGGRSWHIHACSCDPFR